MQAAIGIRGAIVEEPGWLAFALFLLPPVQGFRRPSSEQGLPLVSICSDVKWSRWQIERLLMGILVVHAGAGRGVEELDCLPEGNGYEARLA